MWCVVFKYCTFSTFLFFVFKILSTNFLFFKTMNELIFFLFFFCLSGYFWHITDIHFDVQYSTDGDIQKSKRIIHLKLMLIFYYGLSFIRRIESYQACLIYFLPVFFVYYVYLFFRWNNTV